MRSLALRLIQIDYDPISVVEVMDAKGQAQVRETAPDNIAYICQR